MGWFQASRSNPLGRTPGDQFCDITLIVDEYREIKCHKSILVIGSKFFQNTFKNSSENTFVIATSYGKMQSIMDILYFGKCEVDLGTLDKFMEIYKYMDIIEHTYL